MCEAVVSGSGCIVGNALGYIAKQVFIVYGLRHVGAGIESCVSTVARRYFNSITSIALGYGSRVLFALPVSNIIGDLIWTSISESVMATTQLAGRCFGLFKEGKQRSLFIARIIAQMACSILGYAAKSTVVYYGMPYVHEALCKIATVATPILCHSAIGSAVISPLLSLLATVYTPTVTVFLADLLGVAVSTGLNICARQIIDQIALCILSPQASVEEASSA